jgi:transposase-like protein
MQPKVKEALHNVWQAETRKETGQAFEHCVKRFSPKYPKVMECLAKDEDSLSAFYNYPAENWRHIRTTIAEAQVAIKSYSVLVLIPGQLQCEWVLR